MTPRTLHEIDLTVHLIQKELKDLCVKFDETGELFQEDLQKLLLRVVELETFQARLLSTLSHARTALIVLCISSAPTAYREFFELFRYLGGVL